MSYGRSPYYIIKTHAEDDGLPCFEFFGHPYKWSKFLRVVAYDEMAQFIASMWRYDHAMEELEAIHGELRDLIERGLEVRPELISWEDPA